MTCSAIETTSLRLGIILCKGRNKIVVEYTLRDAGKPMGAAQYRLSPALPEKADEGSADDRRADG
jgi:hypothetical protein